MMISRRASTWMLVVSAIVGLLAPTASAQPRDAPPAPPLPAPDSQRLLRALEDAFVSVADRATPSVVNVSVKVKREAQPEAGPSPETEERFKEFFGPELFERFFRRRNPREEGRAAGSGVIVDARGYIVTNNHVVENATEIEVRLSDGQQSCLRTFDWMLAHIKARSARKGASGRVRPIFTVWSSTFATDSISAGMFMPAQ